MLDAKYRTLSLKDREVHVLEGEGRASKTARFSVFRHIMTLLSSSRDAFYFYLSLDRLTINVTSTLL